MAIQIGKYKRPGIFIEEFDNSIIASPTVFGVTSLVLGFSKKGPVNTPVLIQNVGDLERIFGPIDRNLERKGSYFHRTIQKMLESNPVFAMNLLSTSDTLDKIEYQSVSTATDRDNDTKREGAYRRFFDTTSFWKRDTESFLNLISGDTGAANRLLSFTNMSDRYISIFIFKSRVVGYNRSLIEWYGSTDKVPSYVSPLDYASDYLVDVLCVAGDWSDYQNLANDSRWASYFTTSGLRKSQVTNFANDRNVNTLAFYEGLSLIPYFRDLNGRNIFIETIINNETERTGLFCAYDLDKVEKDYSTGILDLLGNNLVGTNDLIDTFKESFNFLSYQDSIVSDVDFSQTFLDIAGGTTGQNVVALGPSLSLTRGNWGVFNTRTTLFSEEFVNGVRYLTASSNITGTSSLTFAFDLADPTLGSATSSNAYCVIGANKILVNGGTSGTFTYSLSNSLYTVSSTTQSYISVFHIDGSTGDIKLTNSTVASTNPSIPATDLALASVRVYVKDGFIVQTGGPTFTPAITFIGVTGTGYNPLTFGAASQNKDYFVTEVSPGKIRVTFNDTAATDTTSNYARHRRIRLFNFLVDMLDSTNISKMAILKSFTTFEKHPLTNASVSNIVTSTTSNKSFDLSLGLSSTPADLLLGNLAFYKLDNEFVLGTDGVITKNGVATTSEGVAAKNSTFYQNYYNGAISTGDFFYKNKIELTSDTRVVFLNDGTFSYFVINGASYSPSGSLTNDDKIIVPDSTLNMGSIILGDSVVATTLTDPATGTAFVAGYEAFKIDIEATQEDLNNVNKIYNNNDDGKVYLRMYVDESELMYTQFSDSLLEAVEPITIANDSEFTLKSLSSNYKQSVEIEVPVGYTEVPNKILVKASRYTEVKVGDFLEAYVDPNITLEADQMPRKLTRILSKRLYAGDSTLTEITCDSRINKTLYGTSDYQTVRYTTIDDYVTTYKTVSLKGFRIRQASMPDGTETRQNAILNMVAKGTSLFRAITNKEAIDFRYLVDSFGLGLTERSKQQLVDICGDRLDCFGFINMPSIKSFKNSSSPNFVDSEGVVQTSFIASGGDLESSPAFLYSFGDGKGSTCVGYFLPYLTINDNGRQVDIPPASYVATTYLRKINLNANGVTPWTIAAGITNGRISNVAQLEMDFTPIDIENLNGAQMNPIVFKRNRGFMIETENTAQTLYRSALSFIHVREVLIELERELAAMLLDFQWKFNTAEIRAEIKLRADNICESYVNRNGLYNYFNKCDEENNTPTLIDNQIGVLDTYVEPIKGMGIIVNNITILRTGAIQAGGFINP